MSRRNKMDEDDFEDKIGGLFQEKLFMTVEEMKARIFHVHMDTEIGEASDYRKLQRVLSLAGPDDQVVFHLNTPGGSVNTAIQILGWIAQSEANILAIVEGCVASAGTLFVMVADSVIVMPHTEFMVHGAAFGTWGPTHRVKDQVDFEEARLRAFMEDYYEGFMTPEEIKQMHSESKEIWMGPDEVIRRLGVRQALREAQENEEVQQVETPKPARKRAKKETA